MNNGITGDNDLYLALDVAKGQLNYSSITNSSTCFVVRSLARTPCHACSMGHAANQAGGPIPALLGLVCQETHPGECSTMHPAPACAARPTLTHALTAALYHTMPSPLV